MDLPSPIQTYFDANARLDASAMLAPFATDAIVRDEGGVFRGPDAIRGWIERASLNVSAIARPKTLETEGELHHVTADVSGDFPGSPVTLAFRFRLANDGIAGLEIG